MSTVIGQPNHRNPYYRLAPSTSNSGPEAAPYRAFTCPPVRDCPLPGVNVYVVHREKLITAPLGNSVLPGITRDSVLQIASDLGITIVEQMIPREMLYIADEAFFTGTAAEVTPIRSVDKINVGTGAIGPITRAIQKEFYAIVRGEKSDRHGWLTPVPVRSKQPVERVRVPAAV